MNVSLLALALLLHQVDSFAAKYPGRQPHPLAPSLPVLTEKEEKRITDVIDRFIKFDTGKLGGTEGRKAALEFHQLGPESIFLLIEGFNQSANLQDSCPAVLIGKKIASILGRSEDLELLTFARESLGSGVTARRHLGVLKDLQLGVMLRRTAVQKKLAANPSFLFQKALAKLAVDERGVVGGMIQYLPIEQSTVDGSGLYFIPCIWVYGHKQGRGNFQGHGMGSALLEAAEADVRTLGAKGLARSSPTPCPARSTSRRS